MCVGVGSFSDPADAQGLAHFLGMFLTNLRYWLTDSHRTLEFSYLIKISSQVDCSIIVSAIVPDVCRNIDNSSYVQGLRPNTTKLLEHGHD